jgi:hypothetical protein
VKVGSSFTTEIEHFRGIFIQKNTPVHLVKGHFLFLDLLPSEAGFLVLFDEGEGMGGVNVGMLSGGDETISTMLFVLLLF